MAGLTGYKSYLITNKTLMIVGCDFKPIYQKRPVSILEYP